MNAPESRRSHPESKRSTNTAVTTIHVAKRGELVKCYCPSVEGHRSGQ